MNPPRCRASGYPQEIFALKNILETKGFQSFLLWMPRNRATGNSLIKNSILQIEPLINALFNALLWG